MANDIIFENKDVKNRHIDLNSETPWYESLGATVAAGSSDTASIGKANIYIYNKELQSDQLQDFRCLELADNVILQFPITFNTAIYNYYIKSYKVDNTSKRLKYTSLETDYNLVQLNENRTATIQKGKYGLNGWEILSISKNDMPFYRYKDGTSEQEYLYAKGSTHLLADIIKDKTIDKNKVIINEASNFGNLAEYEIPGYYGIGNAGKAKTITLFGNINSVPEERQDFSFNQPLTYGNKNSTSTSAKMINQVPTEMRPYLLFEDFGEYPDSNNIPSDAYPLRYTYNYDETTKQKTCIISFRGQRINIPLYDDDKVILYIREPVGPEQIEASGMLLMYAKKYYTSEGINHNYLVLDSVYAKGLQDESEITYCIKGLKIRRYDITESQWSANDNVKCNLPENTDAKYNSIIEKTDLIMQYDPIANKYENNRWGLGTIWSNQVAKKYSISNRSITDVLTEPLGRTVIIKDVPYIINAPKIQQNTTEIKKEMTVEQIDDFSAKRTFTSVYNTNISTTIGIIKPGNVMSPYHIEISNYESSTYDDVVDLPFLSESPITTYQPSDYTHGISFNEITDDFTILGYPAEFRLMNRQGFNQVITTKDILNPFKTNKRINQPACAIVLWRKYTREPITKKIEKLS